MLLRLQARAAADRDKDAVVDKLIAVDREVRRLSDELRAAVAAKEALAAQADALAEDLRAVRADLAQTHTARAEARAAGELAEATAADDASRLVGDLRTACAERDSLVEQARASARDLEQARARVTETLSCVCYTACIAYILNNSYGGMLRLLPASSAIDLCFCRMQTQRPGSEADARTGGGPSASTSGRLLREALVQPAVRLAQLLRSGDNNTVLAGTLARTAAQARHSSPSWPPHR
jgi:hypothetical protein